MKTTFTCSKCNEQKTVNQDFTTGYGVDKDGNKVCYECCGKEDERYLIDNGKLQGYLTGQPGNEYFANWPGSFKIPVLYSRKSYHNFAGRNGRTDFWLKYKGNNYHGINIGKDNEIATIRKTKN